MPRYGVSEFSLDGYPGIRLTDADRASEVRIFPPLGDNAVAFRTTPEGGGTVPTDVVVPPDRLADIERVPFAAGLPILFAFPNRVRDGRYAFRGVTHEMRELLAHGWDRGAGQAIHGIVDDKAWSVEAAGTDDDQAHLACAFRPERSASAFRQFPFPCTLTVVHRLKDGQLHLEACVENTGDSALPLGFGVHGWFPAAILPGTILPEARERISPARRSRSRVSIPAAARWELEKLMPTGRILPVDGEIAFDLRAGAALGDREYDDVFTALERDARGATESSLRDPQSGLELFVEASPEFREWVLYAPRDRPVVALEPYTCTTDAANLSARGVDSGLIALGPGETWRATLTFGLRRR